MTAGSLRPLPLFLTALLLIAGATLDLSSLHAADSAASPGRPPPAGEIRFLVLGDWGRQGGARQREVAQRMGDHAAARGADFVITTGDNFYEDGVRSVDDGNWRSSFQEIYTDPSLNIPWYPVLGNHDYHGSTQAQIDYSHRDGRWRMPGRYHSFERPVGAGRALFVFLDTNPFLGAYRWMKWKYPDLRAQDPADQLQWLDKVLGESTAEWKIVVGHHPLYSAGAMHGPTGGLRGRLQPLFEKHGVHVYFAGHDHNLQHLKPPGPTHYVISGGGSEARPVGTHQSALFARGALGFVSVTLRGDNLHLVFIDDKGATLYRADIPRRRGSPEGEP